MINAKQLLQYVIEPTLVYITLSTVNLCGKNAAMLLLGTAMVESKLTYLKQIGKGPALGLYQMEPDTFKDIWENYLKFHPALAAKVRSLNVPGLPDEQEIIGNLYFATAMARIHYYRQPSALPPADDWKAMAMYHKKYYNTYLGSTDVKESEKIFKQICEGMD